MGQGREDENLPVQEARAGRPEAWDRLFRRFQRPLYAFVYHMVQDEQTALDLVQESFINATRHIGSLREDRRIGAWLFGIAHQKCIQHLRRIRPALLRDEGLLENLPDLGEQPDEEIVRREQEQLFRELIDELAFPQRSVLVLHFLEGFSLDEIARLTGTPVGTVKSRLHHAKHKLRLKLNSHEQNSARTTS